jgi:uncharacterized membrane protein YagU involved in acid resistance
MSTRIAVIHWRGQRFGMFVPEHWSDLFAHVVWLDLMRREQP